MPKKTTKRQQVAGMYNGKPNAINFYTTIPEIEHTPLLDWERENFYSRSNTKTMARKRIISLMKWKRRYFVAVCPQYQDHDPKKLLDFC